MTKTTTKNPNAAGQTAKKYREVRVRCYGTAESGVFAELENGDRVYGLTGAAPHLLAALKTMLTTAMPPESNRMEFCTEKGKREIAREAIAKVTGGVE